MVKKRSNLFNLRRPRICAIDLCKQFSTIIKAFHSGFHIYLHETKIRRKLQSVGKKLKKNLCNYKKM